MQRADVDGDGGRSEIARPGLGSAEVLDVDAVRDQRHRPSLAAAGGQTPRTHDDLARLIHRDCVEDPEALQLPLPEGSEEPVVSDVVDARPSGRTREWGERDVVD